MRTFLVLVLTLFQVLDPGYGRYLLRNNNDDGVVSVYTTQAPKQAASDEGYYGIANNITSSLYRLLGLKKEKTTRNEKYVSSYDDSLETLMEDYGLNSSFISDTVKIVIEALNVITSTEAEVVVDTDEDVKQVEQDIELTRNMIRKTIQDTVGEPSSDTSDENKDEETSLENKKDTVTFNATVEIPNDMSNNKIMIGDLTQMAANNVSETHFVFVEEEDEAEFVESTEPEDFPRQDFISNPIQILGRMFGNLVNVAVDSVSRMLIPRISWYKISEFADSFNVKVPPSNDI